MPEFDETSIERIIGACQENCSAIAQSLNLCFDYSYRIELGDSLPWDPDTAPEACDGPGLVVCLEIEQQGILCLIPASMPLPEWYTQPTDSEESRIQTLAMEWSLTMLPADLESTQFKSVAVENLNAAVAQTNPVEWAALIELHLFDESTGEEPASDTAAEPVAKLFLVLPVANPALGAEEQPSEEAVAAPAAKPSPPVAPASAAAPVTPVPTTEGGTTPADLGVSRRVLGLPVTVSVRLAEKKIELGTLLSLSPGVLIPFNKSCEDLLDLYVNNQLYCRGEAVKIGEKFGLKINEVGIEEVRESSVVSN